MIDYHTCRVIRSATVCSHRSTRRPVTRSCTADDSGLVGHEIAISSIGNALRDEFEGFEVLIELVDQPAVDVLAVPRPSRYVGREHKRGYGESSGLGLPESNKSRSDCLRPFQVTLID